MKRHPEHYPAADWHCACGEDFFGGTAAYSNSELRAHIDWHTAGRLRRTIRRLATWVRGVSITIPAGRRARAKVLDDARRIYFHRG